MYYVPMPPPYFPEHGGPGVPPLTAAIIIVAVILFVVGLKLLFSYFLNP